MPHDMPQNGMVANFNHWLGANDRFLGKPGSHSARQNDAFHDPMASTARMTAD